MTLITDLQSCHSRLSIAQRGTHDEPAKREFAIAKTHLEDAMMRVNRGFAMANGMYQQADVEAEASQS